MNQKEIKELVEKTFIRAKELRRQYPEFKRPCLDITNLKKTTANLLCDYYYQRRKDGDYEMLWGKPQFIARGVDSNKCYYYFTIDNEDVHIDFHTRDYEIKATE